MIEHGYDVKESAGAELSGSVRHVSQGDLLALVRQVEEAVVRGTAQMRDYETFVRCQEELLRREFLHFEREQASNY